MRDPGAAAATYIDLRIPARPAAGGVTEVQGGAPASLTAVAPADAAAAAASMPATVAGAPMDLPAATAEPIVPAVP